jgi:hypothetical protein
VSRPIDDPDPMADLDPWTEGYIRLRLFLNTAARVTPEVVTELCQSIREKLPYPAPPRDIEVVIRADISMAQEEDRDALTGLFWEPEPKTQLWTPS